VSEHRGDLVQLGIGQARDHGAHVRQRHQLILANRDGRDRREDASGVDAMQVDGFGQTNKALGPVTLRVFRAAREQVVLDRKHELLVGLPLLRGSRDTARRARETRRKFLGAAIGGHGQRARQLEALRGLARFQRETHDAPLHHAPGAGHGMGAVRRADHDEPRHAVRKALAESQRHHAAIRRSGNRAQRGNAEMIDEPQQQFRLVVGGHGGKRLAVARTGGVGAGAQVIETEYPESLRIQRQPRPNYFMPPATPLLVRQPDAA
jgi:hypothetical protein